MPVKYYAHPAFGDIALKKNKLSKGLRIIIRSSKSITVTFPSYLSYNEAINFVNEKEEWISENLNRFNQTAKNKLFLPNQPYNTFAHELLFEKIAAGNPYIKVDRTTITVYYTNEEMLAAPATQEHIQLAIEKVLKNEALKYLPSRVDFWAEKFSLKFTGISVKKMRTRWGSCSSTGKINLNIHLMRLPVHLIDYVILHELAHTKQHNHGPNFWKLLNDLTGGNAKKYALEMKKYRTTVY
jgi:predicted metal-dependent hydrolase